MKDPMDERPGNDPTRPVHLWIACRHVFPCGFRFLYEEGAAEKAGEKKVELGDFSTNRKPVSACVHSYLMKSQRRQKYCSLLQPETSTSDQMYTLSLSHAVPSSTNPIFYQ